MPFVACALAGTFACQKKPEPPRRTEPWLASAVPSASAAAPAPASAAVRYTVTPDSRVSFAAPARRGVPRGHFGGVSGAVTLRFGELSKTQARIEVDLRSIAMEATNAPDVGDLDATARNWLGLGERVESSASESRRRAVFELLRVEDAAPEALSFGGSERGAALRALGTAVGTVSFGGFRAPVRLAVELATGAGSTGSAPERLTIRSRAPLVINLPSHDVQPRDAAGLPAPDASRLWERVGRDARVEFALALQRDDT